MNTPKRPATVSATATCIPPDSGDPSGITQTAQMADLNSFLRIVQKSNADANAVNQSYLQSYAANAQECAAYHLPPPKMRDLLPMYQPVIVWADVNGNPHDIQEPGDAAWIDEQAVPAGN